MRKQSANFGEMRKQSANFGEMRKKSAFWLISEIYTEKCVNKVRFG